MAHFEFHYAKYKEASEHLATADMTVKDFQRWDDIREASATAIALEAGIITEIPADGKLSSADYQRTLMIIRRYEIAQSEVAA